MNRDKYDIKYRKTHRTELKEKSVEYRKRNKNKISKQRQEYYLKNKKEILSRNYKYIKSRSKLDVNFRIVRNLRLRIWEALKGKLKSRNTAGLLGCSIIYLKYHLESQFKPGMSWSNYGKWHIDHIKPCAKFNLSVISEQRLCFHYTNLQPLWAEENIKKGSRQ